MQEVVVISKLADPKQSPGSSIDRENPVRAIEDHYGDGGVSEYGFVYTAEVRGLDFRVSDIDCGRHRSRKHLLPVWIAPLVRGYSAATETIADGHIEWPGQTAIDSPLFTYQLKSPLTGTCRFGFAQEQVTPRLLQRIGEQVEHCLLKRRIQVDQKVATRDQVYPWKRHAAADVLLSEDHCLSQHFGNLEAVMAAFEKTRAVINRHVFQDVFWIKSTPCEGDGIGSKIGRKDLYVPISNLRSQLIRD